MAAATTSFKTGEKVKARSARTGKVLPGTFMQERPSAKGVFLDVDLGEENGGIKSFRPSQVIAA